MRPRFWAAHRSNNYPRYWPDRASPVGNAYEAGTVSPEISLRWVTTGTMFLRLSMDYSPLARNQGTQRRKWDGCIEDYVLHDQAQIHIITHDLTFISTSQLAQLMRRSWLIPIGPTTRVVTQAKNISVGIYMFISRMPLQSFTYWLHNNIRDLNGI